MAEQQAAKVQFQTRVIQWQKKVLMLKQDAEAKWSAIKVQNDAYCVQYKTMQEEASKAFGVMLKDKFEGELVT